MITLVFDIMLFGRFVFTLRYRHCLAFVLDMNDVDKAILSKRPSLKDKPYQVIFCHEEK